MTDSFAQATVISSQPFLELSNRGKTLRFDLDKDVYRLGRDHHWSDLEIPETGWNVLSRRQAVLKKEGENYRIYDGDRAHPSRNGLFIEHTRINLSEGYLLTHGAQLEIGQDPRNQVLLTYCNPIDSHLVIPKKRHLILRGLKDWPVEIGRFPSPDRYASMQLDSPTVSRLHATIYPNHQGGHILKDLSTNGTFVDGKRLEKPISLTSGNIIQIGPFTLLYRRETLELLNTGHHIRLDAHNLCREVPDQKAGKKTILNDISLVIEPGQLVALVGGSGAGKSTLMKALLGIEPTNSGNVLLNGDNLRQHWGIYRSQIGYVPQDDIVHLDLTVEEVLTYACQLRLPPDTNIEQVVNDTLEQVKLNHVRTNFVRYLSGGQRKRVSIAVELLVDPKLFFLDEPTSGLDPGLDKEMMKLLRDLADQERTIILITHATANIAVCDRIAFLGRGGKLCYFGPPQEALEFFEMPSLDFKYFADIYLKLEQGSTEVENQAIVDEWAKQYYVSDKYKSYIKASLSPGKEQQLISDSSSHTSSPLKQLLLLSQRYYQLVRRDLASVGFTLLSGPITIALTALCLEGEAPLKYVDSPTATQAPLALRLLFVFSCIAIWLGLSNSIGEIVKESAIYCRERLLNLGLLPYLGSKFLIRTGIALLQSFLIVLAILIGFGAPQSELIPWWMGVGITTFLTLVASTSLSLMLSALVKSENQGNGILPLVMIPQIIFSGVLFDLEGVARPLSWLMLSRWSVAAYGVLADLNQMVPSSAGDSLPMLFEPSSTYDATWENLTLNWGILCLFTVIYLLVTLCLQKRKDIF